MRGTPNDKLKYFVNRFMAYLAYTLLGTVYFDYEKINIHEKNIFSATYRRLHKRRT
jgi:hypothetical protein